MVPGELQFLIAQLDVYHRESNLDCLDKVVQIIQISPSLMQTMSFVVLFGINCIMEKIQTSRCNFILQQSCHTLHFIGVL